MIKTIVVFKFNLASKWHVLMEEFIAIRQSFPQRHFVEGFNTLSLVTINSKWTYQRWLCLPNVFQCAESHHADRFTRLSCPYDDPNTLLSRPQDRTEMSL